MTKDRLQSWSLQTACHSCGKQHSKQDKPGWTLDDPVYPVAILTPNRRGALPLVAQQKVCDRCIYSPSFFMKDCAVIGTNTQLKRDCVFVTGRVPESWQTIRLRVPTPSSPRTTGLDTQGLEL
jgi:hypothetical protein